MKFLFQSALGFGLLLLIGCGSDSTEAPGPAPAPPTGDISATLRESTGDGVIINTDWFVPKVTAIMQAGRLSITAINEGTGETLTIVLPDTIADNYANTGSNPVNGFAEYKKSATAAITYSSVEFGANTPVFSVTISRIDTTLKELEGSFIVSCVNPDNDDQAVYFTDGSFNDVPYTVEPPIVDEPEPEPEIEFRAVLTSPDGEANSNWSLPVAGASLSPDGSLITASNPATGETMAISIPSNQVGFYNNGTSDSEDGFAEYTPAMGAAAFSSLNFESADDPAALFVINIDEIDEANETIGGTFQIATYSADGSESYTFGSGSFSGVPFTGDTGAGGGGGGGNDNSFSVLVDGANFDAESIIAAEASGNILITATSSSGNNLSINFSSSATAGSSFELTAGSVNTGTFQTSGFQTYTATSGSIDISAHDPEANVVSGTFAFEATELLGTNTISVTEGSFEVTYPD